MDGCRDDHAKSDGERQIDDILYAESKKNDSNEIIYKTETDSQRKQTYGDQREKGERDKLGVWDSHIHTAIYKQQGPTAQHGNNIQCLVITYNIGKETEKKKNPKWVCVCVCVCITESLCNTSKTTTTL